MFQVEDSFVFEFSRSTLNDAPVTLTAAPFEGSSPRSTLKGAAVALTANKKLASKKLTSASCRFPGRGVVFFQTCCCHSKLDRPCAELPVSDFLKGEIWCPFSDLFCFDLLIIRFVLPYEIAVLCVVIKQCS